MNENRDRIFRTDGDQEAVRCFATKQHETCGLARIFHTDLLRNPGRLMEAALDSHFDLGSMYSYSPTSKCSPALPHQASRLPRHDQHEISGLALFKRASKQRLFLLLLSCLLFARVLAASQGAETSCTLSSESIATAKRNALDLAEASLNDGFRVRDGEWVVSLTPKEPLLLQVTLFEGNQYWFIAAAAPPAEVLQMTIYDAKGHLLKLDPWKDRLAISGARTAEGLIAPCSGKFFIKLQLLKSAGKAKADTCLVYAYK